MSGFFGGLALLLAGVLAAIVLAAAFVPARRAAMSERNVGR